MAACAFVPAAPAGARQLDWAVAHRINVVRAHHGLRALRVSRALERAAEEHCDQMLGGQVLSHGLLLQRLSNYSSARTFGETIAWMPRRSSRQVVIAWMRSAPHRAVLLSPMFRRIGVGAESGTMAGAPGTSFTADFAS